MKLPFIVNVFYKDKESEIQCVSFNSFDEASEQITRIQSIYNEYYLYKGSLNESLAHLDGCVTELTEKYGFAVVNAKHWTVFFHPKKGLHFSEDRDDEFSKRIKLYDYIIEVGDNDNVNIFII